ncbi:uncharacterized protein An11g11250 [Aspergillus niger]|uniref:Tetratricopeptide repeat and J domain-containing co-chaperone DNJ1 n=2 Tax=Aspergillus niger TaxID=5061 RepID=A2QY43_ASPNC|nr:uncharacterized protein An11g11250 [Aspergillus niger]CAK40923.1 unnamed protein product [Aspergillus niger]
MHLPLTSLTVFLAFLSAGHGLQSSQIPSDTPLSSLIASAKSHLAGGSPREALVYFDAAVSRDPTNYLTLFQRGATQLSLGKSSLALEDFDRVLQLKPDFESALLQRARLKASSADWAGALGDLDKAGKRSTPEYQELRESRDAASAALEAESRGAWDVCVSQASIALAKATMSLSLRRARAHCRFETGETEQGISDLLHVLQIHPSSLEPYLQISSTLFYALGDTDRGISQVRKCLHSDPDSKPCNRLYRRERQLVKQFQKLEEAVNARKHNNAINILKDAAQAKEDGLIHPKAPSSLYASLVERTCEVFREAQMPKRASPYCSEALTFDPNSLPALLLESQHAIDEDRFDDAIRLLNQAKEHHSNSREVQALLQKAQVLQKRSKQKDYYKVLGVSRDADERTIKRAYRQLTKQHHPDKAISQGVTKEEAEKKMASINEAYEVLSDPELRSRYDNGDDPNDPESQRGRPFQGSPFGPGGQFFFQQGGGPQFKFSGQGFNFPGGFPFR